MAQRVGIVILAGGRSSRMGTAKLLLPLGAVPTVTHVARAAVATSLRPIIVVLGHQADQIRAAVMSLDVTFIVNPSYQDGQSTSLRAGLAALPRGVSGAIILLGDQPLVTAMQIERLVATAATSGAPIVAASYAGVRGNPVYFARSCFPELQAITGDVGGRGVVANHASEVALVEMDDYEAGFDLDEPEDYARLRRIWAARQTTG